jgi:hypothetical protein
LFTVLNSSVKFYKILGFGLTLFGEFMQKIQKNKKAEKNKKKEVKKEKRRKWT